MAENAAALAQEESLLIRSVEALPQAAIVDWLRALRGRPFVEQSHFDVTSVLKVRAAGGEIHYVGGVNVENAELTVGTCAEEAALGAATTAFGPGFDVLEAWVMGAPSGATSGDLACYPCGECRQRLAQYTDPSAPIHIISLDGEEKDVKTRAELLPMAFSFRDLDVAEEEAEPIPFGMEPNLRLAREPQSRLSHADVSAWLAGLQGDVRVTEQDRGMVLRLSNGAYVAGVRMENAAYPASTTAVQVALGIMNTAYGVQSIEEMWLAGEGEAVSGAVLQVLQEFAVQHDISIHRISKDGAVHTQKLNALAALGLSTFAVR